jgi:hypothetical protein
VTMLPLAHAGLTPPAVAGPGCNEWLGCTVLRSGVTSLTDETTGKPEAKNWAGLDLFLAGALGRRMPKMKVRRA